METTAHPLAVVTGASSGIGFELAEQFAAHGFDLIIAAEDDSLATAAAALTTHGTPAQTVQTVQTDLSSREGVETLHRAITATRRPVAAAALNAGVGHGGPFLKTELADELAIIDLNVTSTVHLAKLLLPRMVEDGQGRILITSSIASTIPGSFQAVYNASKSFLQSFAQALQNELKETGVTVTSLMPGPTETEFFARADMLDTKVGRSEKDDAGLVAAQGFEAMMAGRDKVVAGSWKTKAQGLVGRVLPDKVKAEGHRRMAKPGSGTDA
ncbi:SDR family NAD(P)-dependent oxidoreductase [Streptomyces sp. NPDC090127]|uniref:SDR family NAD(P)-dependent oxidoreductase n=1 Tax=Streptomyces sp. NPDC090127 TaxID=3365953 RepID=UPI003814F859